MEQPEMDLHSMKRKQLQSLCKKHGIPANKSNVEMINLLTLLLTQENEISVSEDKGDIINANDEPVSNDVSTKKAKKVRFSPENELREYEPSAWKEIGKKKRKRGRAIQDQCKVSREVNAARTTTRSRAGKEVRNESDIDAVVVPVGGGGQRSPSRAAAEKARMKLRSREVVTGESRDDGVGILKRSRRVNNEKEVQKDTVVGGIRTRSKAKIEKISSIETDKKAKIVDQGVAKIVVHTAEPSGAVPLKGSVKNLDGNDCSRKSVAPKEGKVEETRKRSRMSKLVSVTAVEAPAEPLEVTEMVPEEIGIPRRTRRKTIALNFTVSSLPTSITASSRETDSMSDGVGEVGQEKQKRAVTKKGSSVNIDKSVVRQPRRTTRNGLRDELLEASEAGTSVEMKRKTASGLQAMVEEAVPDENQSPFRKSTIEIVAIKGNSSSMCGDVVISSSKEESDRKSRAKRGTAMLEFDTMDSIVVEDTDAIQNHGEAQEQILFGSYQETRKYETDAEVINMEADVVKNGMELGAGYKDKMSDELKMADLQTQATDIVSSSDSPSHANEFISLENDQHQEELPTSEENRADEGMNECLTIPMKELEAVSAEVGTERNEESFSLGGYLYSQTDNFLTKVDENEENRVLDQNSCNVPEVFREECVEALVHDDDEQFCSRALELEKQLEATINEADIVLPESGNLASFTCEVVETNERAISTLNSTGVNHFQDLRLDNFISQSLLEVPQTIMQEMELPKSPIVRLLTIPSTNPSIVNTDRDLMAGHDDDFVENKIVENALVVRKYDQTVPEEAKAKEHVCVGVCVSGTSQENEYLHGTYAVSNGDSSKRIKILDEVNKPEFGAFQADYAIQSSGHVAKDEAVQEIDRPTSVCLDVVDSEANDAGLTAAAEVGFALDNVFGLSLEDDKTCNVTVEPNVEMDRSVLGSSFPIDVNAAGIDENVDKLQSEIKLKGTETDSNNPCAVLATPQTIAKVFKEDFTERKSEVKGGDNLVNEEIGIDKVDANLAGVARDGCSDIMEEGNKCPEKTPVSSQICKNSIKVSECNSSQEKLLYDMSIDASVMESTIDAVAEIDYFPAHGDDTDDQKLGELSKTDAERRRLIHEESGHDTSPKQQSVGVKNDITVLIDQTSSVSDCLTSPTGGQLVDGAEVPQGAALFPIPVNDDNLKASPCFINVHLESQPTKRMDFGCCLFSPIDGRCHSEMTKKFVLDDPVDTPIFTKWELNLIRGSGEKDQVEKCESIIEDADKLFLESEFFGGENYQMPREVKLEESSKDHVKHVNNEVMRLEQATSEAVFTTNMETHVESGPIQSNGASGMNEVDDADVSHSKEASYFHQVDVVSPPKHATAAEAFDVSAISTSDYEEEDVPELNLNSQMGEDCELDELVASSLQDAVIGKDTTLSSAIQFDELQHGAPELNQMGDEVAEMKCNFFTLPFEVDSVSVEPSKVQDNENNFTNLEEETAAEIIIIEAARKEVLNELKTKLEMYKLDRSPEISSREKEKAPELNFLQRVENEEVEKLCIPTLQTDLISDDSTLSAVHVDEQVGVYEQNQMERAVAEMKCDSFIPPVEVDSESGELKKNQDNETLDSASLEYGIAAELIAIEAARKAMLHELKSELNMHKLDQSPAISSREVATEENKKNQKARLIARQLSSSVIRRNISRTGLQPDLHDMKENTPLIKLERSDGFTTAIKSLSRRRPLEDLGKNQI